METYNGYCVKCKAKRDFEGEISVSKIGMNMAKGKCPICGTTVNRILGKAGQPRKANVSAVQDLLP